MVVSALTKSKTDLITLLEDSLERRRWERGEIVGLTSAIFYKVKYKEEMVLGKYRRI